MSIASTDLELRMTGSGLLHVPPKTILKTQRISEHQNMEQNMVVRHGFLGESSRARQQMKRKKMSFDVNDVLFDIFSRIPAHLLRETFKYQCRDWFNIIKDSSFIYTQLRKSKRGFISSEKSDNSSIIRFLEFEGLEYKVRDLATYPLRLNIEASCNGLLLLSVPGDLHYVYHILNPITKLLITLPAIPSKSYYTTTWCELVYVCTANQYKVVQLVDQFDSDINKHETEFRIIVPGHNCAWVKIDFPLVAGIKFGRNLHDRVVVGNFLWWAIDSTESLLCLDLENENFQVVHFPSSFSVKPCLFKIADCLSLVIWTNGLSLRDGNGIDIWSLKYHKTKGKSDAYREEWQKLNFEAPDQKYMDTVKRITTMKGSLDHGETIVFHSTGGGTCIIFDVFTRVFKEIKLKQPFDFSFSYFHVNSLVGLETLA